MTAIAGWLTVIWTLLTAIGCGYWLWVAATAPHRFRAPERLVRAPQVAVEVQWYDKDNVIPWR